MTKKSNSKHLSKKSKKQVHADTTFGRESIVAAKQIRAHVRGEKVLPSHALPSARDVKAIRLRLKMSQAEFASAFASNRRTLQE